MATDHSSHILLIDDDELSREVLELHLAGAGFRITEAESGDHAVALLRGASLQKIDAVLSDLQMPGLSGPALASELRRFLPTSAPIIAMSASEPPPDHLIGFGTFLRKPFTPEQFTTALSALLSSQPVSIDSVSFSVPAEAHTPVVLEIGVLAQLRTMLSPDQLTELFLLSFSELKKHLARMDVALHAGDDIAFRESAHAIKGSFAILGAHELKAQAAHLETGTYTPADQAASLKQIPEAADRLKRMLTSHGLQFSSDLSSGQETK